MPIGGIISGGASLLGGLFGSSAASDAAKTQARAANRATDLQGMEYLDIANKLLPFLQIGTTGAGVLANNYFGIDPTGKFNPNAPFLQPISSVVGQPPTPPRPTDSSLRWQFTESPGYGYLIKQMTDAVQNSAAGRTGAISGNAMRALQTNAGGIADQDWWNFYNQMVGSWQNQAQNYQTQYQDEANRRNNIIAVLQGLAGSGQNAAAQTGGFGQNAANNIASNMLLAGSARAAGTLGSANAFTNAFNNPAFTNGLSNGINYLFGNSGVPGDFAGVTAPGPTINFGGGNYGGF